MNAERLAKVSTSQSDIQLVASKLGVVVMARVIAQQLFAECDEQIAEAMPKPALNAGVARLDRIRSVIIDLPQVADAVANARATLERDVGNLADHSGQLVPALRDTAYGKEFWSRYESGKLQPKRELTGALPKKRRWWPMSARGCSSSRTRCGKRWRVRWSAVKAVRAKVSGD